MRKGFEIIYAKKQRRIKRLKEKLKMDLVLPRDDERSVQGNKTENVSLGKEKKSEEEAVRHDKDTRDTTYKEQNTVQGATHPV